MTPGMWRSMAAACERFGDARTQPPHRPRSVGTPISSGRSSPSPMRSMPISATGQLPDSRTRLVRRTSRVAPRRGSRTAWLSDSGIIARGVLLLASPGTWRDRVGGLLWCGGRRLMVPRLRTIVHLHSRDPRRPAGPPFWTGAPSGVFVRGRPISSWRPRSKRPGIRSTRCSAPCALPERAFLELDAGSTWSDREQTGEPDPEADGCADDENQHG